MSTIASSRIDFRMSKLTTPVKQSLHTLCNMIKCSFKSNLPKINIFIPDYITFNSYIFSVSKFWIRRYKLILNSQNLLRIPPYNMLNTFFCQKILFNLNHKRSTPTDLHYSDIHLAPFFYTRITQNIFFIRLNRPRA